MPVLDPESRRAGPPAIADGRGVGTIPRRATPRDRTACVQVAPPDPCSAAARGAAAAPDSFTGAPGSEMLHAYRRDDRDRSHRAGHPAEGPPGPGQGRRTPTPARPPGREPPEAGQR